MPLDPTMLSLMTDSVTIEPFAGIDQYQKPIYGAAVSYPRAQILSWAERMIGPSGREVTSAAAVIIPERLVIDPRSRLTLTGWTPNQPPILGVRPYGGGGLNLDCTQVLF